MRRQFQTSSARFGNYNVGLIKGYLLRGARLNEPRNTKIMALISKREDQITSLFRWTSAKEANDFIDLLIRDAASSNQESWQAEKYISERIDDWNAGDNPYKLICGSGGRHVYIHSTDNDSSDHRLAIIYEN